MALKYGLESEIKIMAISANIRRLIQIAGPSLSAELPHFAFHRNMGAIGDELRELLAERNGFYAFESALIVRPSCRARAATTEAGLEEWNEPALWIDAYSDLVSDCLFFAEDAFGAQFCIRKDGVFTFDPETGEQGKIAGSLDGWAEVVLRDYESLTGYPLAHAWQKQHGALPPRKRLIPKIPFVLNGNFEPGNLYLGDAAEAMRARASIAQQIRNLPEGSFSVD